MSHDELAGLRNRLGISLARGAILKSQDLLRALRNDRANKRKKRGWHRLAKEFRQLKSLLLAEEQRESRKARERLTQARRHPTSDR